MAARSKSHGLLRRLASAFVAGAVLLAAFVDGRAADRDWVVIVHPANPVHAMKRSDLERVWRRSTKFWADGSAVVPLNLPGGQPLREAFQQAVLRSDDEELAQWWNRAYFQGVSPPVVLQTGAAVKAYVAATPGAIGYIPAADADATVRILEVDLGH